MWLFVIGLTLVTVISIGYREIGGNVSGLRDVVASCSESGEAPFDIQCGVVGIYWRLHIRGLCLEFTEVLRFSDLLVLFTNCLL